MEEKTFKFGDTFKKVVQEHNLKRLQIAKILNCSPNYITMITKGKRIPSIEFLQKFCKYFELSPNECSVIFNAAINEMDELSFKLPQSSDYKYILAEVLQMIVLEPDTNPKITYMETFDVERSIHHLAQQVISKDGKNIINNTIIVPPSEEKPFVTLMPSMNKIQ